MTAQMSTAPTMAIPPSSGTVPRCQRSSLGVATAPTMRATGRTTRVRATDRRNAASGGTTGRAGGGAGGGGQHYILRVASLFGGSRAKSSLDRLAAAIRRGDTVKAFANRTVTPSYVPDLADAAAALLAGDVPFGLYHCVNSGHGTWVDVACAIAVESGLDPDRAVTPVPFDPAAFPARRPTYAALSNAALAAHGVTMPSWRDAIGRYVRTLPA